MARNKRLEIRLDEYELESLGRYAKEAGRSLSDYVRFTLLTAEPPRPRGSESSVNRGMADPPGSTLPPPRVGGVVFETDLTAGDVVRTEWTPPDEAVQSWPPTGRSCESCGNGVGSPTLKRCSCGGRIVPPPS